MGKLRALPFSTAIAVLAFALAAPAAAPAAEWTVEGEPLTEPQAIELSGSHVIFVTGFAALECPVDHRRNSSTG